MVEVKHKQSKKNLKSHNKCPKFEQSYNVPYIAIMVSGQAALRLLMTNNKVKCFSICIEAICFVFVVSTKSPVAQYVLGIESCLEESFYFCTQN